MAWFEHGTSRIYFEEQGSGDPVLLLPGWAGSIGELVPLREALARSYRVIAADLPGSGQSQPMPRNYTATYYEEDARSFVAFLQHLGTGPTHLLGFSDGGEVELLMAATAPDLARSLATWSSAGAIPQALLPMVEAMSNMVDNPIPPLQAFRDHLVATYGETNARANIRNFTSAGRAIIERGGDISLSKVGGIKCPVLLIVGERDFVISPSMVSELAALIPGSESIVVEGAGHAVQDDRPEWLEQTLLDWLKRH